MYPEAEQPSLKSLVQQFRPRRILNIGPAGQDVFGEYLQQHPDAQYDTIPDAGALADLEQAGQYDLCLVSHVLENLPKADAEHLLASLRDVHCEKLIAIVPVGKDWPDLVSHWQPNEMLGLGFTRVGEFDSRGLPVHMYAFDIEHYKTTPDWLNSRYWANPELFGKFWW